MKKLLVLVVVCMLCVSMSGIVASITVPSESEGTNVVSDGSYTATTEASSIQKAVNKFTSMEKVSGSSGSMNLKDEVAASITVPSESEGTNVVSDGSYTATTEASSIQKAVNKFTSMEKVSGSSGSMNLKDEEKRYTPSQPSLGDDEIFGLWIRIVYNGKEFLQKIEGITIDIIRGKLNYPRYRTPIKFNVDDDPEDDIETGFGFFSYSIDEITEYGTETSHPGWATAFDFKQINNQLDDQMGELEVWQEFHINLSALKNKGKGTDESYDSDSSETTDSNRVKQTEDTRGGSILGQLMERIIAPSSNPVTQSRNTGIGSLLEQLMECITGQRTNAYSTSLHGSGSILALSNEHVELMEDDDGDEDIKPLMAGEDYFVTRVGYRSPSDQKIPGKMEKTFTVAKDNIFRPVILQHEMRPYEIIGTASNDVMFSFQAYKAGQSDPSYDIEFSVNFDPAVRLITQFTPRTGRIFYYYDDVGSSGPLDVTFSSQVNQGGDSSEEKEGTLSLTLTFDTPNAVAGSGKWMCFDVDLLGDFEPLGGKFTYTASHKFDVGIKVSSPRFEQKVQINGIPRRMDVQWDADILVVPGAMFYAHADGFVELSMSESLDEIIVYYPKSDPSEPDIVFLDVPKGLPASMEVGGGATLNVDLDNMQNSENYIEINAYHDFSSNLNEINIYLPDVEEPVVKVTDIPSDVSASAKLYWNKLEGYAHAHRGTTGAPDPFYLNLEVDNYKISNYLEIRNGHITTSFHIAALGYFNIDTSPNMFYDKLEITDLATGNELILEVDDVSAKDFRANWDIDTSGNQPKIRSLGFNGVLDTLKNFDISLTLKGKNIQFDGSWSMGEYGDFSIDFEQEEDVRLDFNLDDTFENVLFHGNVTLKNKLHFDISWRWQQGSYTDPAYFKINEGINEGNIRELYLYFTYKNKWGAEATLKNGGVYVCVEWYWYKDQFGLWHLDIWPVFDIYGELDLHLLLTNLKGETRWYRNVEDG